MKILLRLVAVLLLALAATDVARAEEFIRAYQSDITVMKEGPLVVRETITVRAEGRAIKRGIFRDFPLTFTGPDGKRHEVDFKVLAVERDGQPENWFTQGITGGVRIYTGKEDVLLSPGEYTYRITYQTGRQIRFFKDYDELYWNVTGNGWDFRIAQTSADVMLPPGANVLDTSVATGRFGETGRDARAVVQGNRVVFNATRQLGRGEGLTIGVKLPKGVIDPPTAADENWWLLKDHRDSIIGIGGFLAVILYYFRAWVAVGRDPPAGVMVPRWDAPEGISPALVNYIDNKGFSGQGWTALSASALDLAVKGYVVLDDLKSSIVIRRTDKPLPQNLPAGQASLLSTIGGAGSTLTIDKKNGERVERVGAAFRSAIESEHRGKYYHSNAGYIAGGVMISAASIAALLAFGGLDEESIGFLIVPAIFALVIGTIAVNMGKGLRRRKSLASRIGAIISLAFLGFFTLMVVSGVVATLTLEQVNPRALVTLLAGGGVALVNVLFFFLMGAPTPLGRRLMDGIEGLRTYLTLAEKDRMNMAGAPQMSPSHYEKLLPYAVALGVEKPWSDTFHTWLSSAAAGAAAASYQPGWYSGGSGRFTDRIGGFSSSMAGTIASTLPQPVSSSGSSFSGGGGSSGGGGGGGGGGGW